MASDRSRRARRTRRGRGLRAWSVAALALAAAVSARADHHGHGEHHGQKEPQAAIPREASPDGAQVYFISPADGARVAGPVTVRFGLRGMGVAPAGIPFENSGHHHLVVDAGTPAPDAPIPADEHHLHFGKGQTEVDLELPPGEHTLQLVLGDRSHIPHDPPVVSERIRIRVETP